MWARRVPLDRPFSSIQPIGLLMSGYASNKQVLASGGLRAAAQSISYEIPLALAGAGVVMMSQLAQHPSTSSTSRHGRILAGTSGSQPVGFLILLDLRLAECERSLSTPEQKEELVARYQTGIFRHNSHFLPGKLHQSVLLGPVGGGLYLGPAGLPRLPVEWVSGAIGQSQSMPLSCRWCTRARWVRQ